MIDFRIQECIATASTNDDVIRAAEKGEAEGFVIRAAQQTAGKGRQGRVWQSPEGNLYLSVLLRPKANARTTALYSFVAALALADTLISFISSIPISLKWPNDVLVNEKKIAGILLEAAPEKNDRVDWLVIGIGLNVEHHPTNTLYPATSLRAEGVPLTPEDLCEPLLAQLGRRYEMLKNEGFGPLRTDWLTYAQKGHMTARLPDRVLEGEFTDLDQEGRLRLRLADGSEKAIASGDVFFTQRN